MKENECLHNIRDELTDFENNFLRNACISDKDILKTGQIISCIVKIFILILTFLHEES